MAHAAWQVTWLGQSSFRIEAPEASVVVDPWISPHEHRLVPPPPLDVVADDVDWVLVTHEHLDHLDLAFFPLLRGRSPGARVVLPAPLVRLVEALVPSDLIVPVLPNDVRGLDGLPLAVAPAIHGVTMEDAYGDGSALGEGPRFVGYVLGDERQLYVSGDTLATGEVATALAPLDVEVALLPINGRDAEREARDIVGNMDAAEAVELALGIGATTLVPSHWDGFAGNTVPPGSAVDAASGRLHVVVPARGKPFRVEVS